MKRLNKNGKKETYILLILLILVILFRCFFSFAVVNGTSMYPTYRNNQILLTRRAFSIDRYDCVVVKYKDKLLVKRVIGLPGEKIEYISNKLYIDGELMEDVHAYGNTDDFCFTVSDDCYYCLGDNREISQDSRRYGEFKKSQIVSIII